MRAVVTGGTARHAMAGLDVAVAGKTGTAYISVPGGYAPDRVIVSFVGFVPADDPAFIMLVKIDEPQDAQLGGTVAAPVFHQLAPQILTYLGIKPDAPVMVQQGN